MKEMKLYWCEKSPTLEDIEQAYQEVNAGYVVQIKWFIPFSGHYDRIISKAVIEKYPDYNDYFKEQIPKCYPV